MDARIYPFKRKATIPNGDGFVDVVTASLLFAAWYMESMISFHSAMLRAGLDAMHGGFHG